MKHTRRILALLLTLVLAMSLCVTAFADDATAGSITIDNAVDGKTYEIYRIFDMDSHNDDYTALNYKVNSAWNGFFATDAAGLNFVDIDAQDYVTWKDGTSVEAFAAQAIAYAERNQVAFAASDKAANGKVEFTGLPLGYYLVKSGLGATCSLDTTKPDVIIKEKNSDSSLTKNIVEDDELKETNDAAVGDTVHFQIQVTVNDGNPVSYVIHDEMSTGLSFDSTSVVVKRNGETLEADGNYTLVTENLTDTCTFHIVFTDDKDDEGNATKSHALNANDVILVTYSAILNDNALVKTDPNTNKAKLTYSADSETQWRTTNTYSLQLDAFKHDAQNNGLKDAQFVLYRKNGDKTEFAVLKGNKVTRWTETEDDATVITTPEGGRFTVEGLDAATYYLREQKAPAGYNKLANDVAVTIHAGYGTGGATITYDIAEVAENAQTQTGATEVGILNQTGAELPSTGGIGTTIFYVLGSVMALGAVILLVTRKRMAA